MQQVDAGAAVQRFAGRLARLLIEFADQLAAGPTPEQAAEWLEGARELTRAATRLDSVPAVANYVAEPAVRVGYGSRGRALVAATLGRRAAHRDAARQEGGGESAVATVH